MKKFPIILSSIILALSIAVPSYAVDLPKLMHNSLAHGYFEASQGNRIQSKKHFRKAFDLAQKTRDWSGMIDAAGGLLALGEREDATECFDKVANMNKKMKDWRASVALAYNYLSFPNNFVDKDRVTQNLEAAEKYASEKKSWLGLLETADTFEKAGSEERALECVDLAKNISAESKNYEAMAEIASCYKKYGEVQKSQEAIKLSKEYKSQLEKGNPYPENFKPYGETVASPKSMSTETQVAERQSADKDIENKIDYLAKLEELNKKEKDYYFAYNYYYDYPYYHHFYSGYDSVTYLPPDWLGEWANYHLRHYNLINGNYIYLGW
ncbi:MAG: hypothetical protein PHI59_01985 [Candidatus Omnitrophica bacterium]|nr:hypothetical protein [Candidatus Omnitrophota bacterium]